MCGINVDTDALVRKYEPLIHSIIAKKLSDYIGDDDLVQVGRIALWKSAKKYDPDKGKFSTYAYKVIYHAMLKELGRRKNEVSLNTPVVGEEDAEFQDFIPDLKPIFEGVEIKFELNDFFQTLSHRQQDVLTHKAKGETHREIAKSIGASYDIVCREMRNINRLWKKFRNRTEEDNYES